MRQSGRSGPPTWFILLLGIAIVFGLYYLWLGLRVFIATGLTVAESTEQAISLSTATAEREIELAVSAPSPLPSFTPVPPCQDFTVRVPIAIVRAAPDINSGIVGSLREGEVVCVIAVADDHDWYLIDESPLTRRIESVYMRRDIIRALNPTAKPTITPSPTITPTPTLTHTPPPSPTARPVRPSPAPPSPSPGLIATAVPPSVSL